MNYKVVAYFLISTFLPLVVKSESIVSKFRYENGFCAKAVDALDGRALRWFHVDMSECGFDMSKPTRLETQISGGACHLVEVYESTLQYGTVRKIHVGSTSADLPKEKCGYGQTNSTEYQLRNGRCLKVKIEKSSIATMPDLVSILDTKSEIPLTECGFKNEDERTDFEIRNNRCTKVFINQNTKGEKVIRVLSAEQDPKNCGIDLSSDPVAVTFSPVRSFGVFAKDTCYMIKTFLSKTGKGLYDTSERTDLEDCSRGANESSEAKENVPTR